MTDASAIADGLSSRGLSYVAGCVVVALVAVFGLLLRSLHARLSDAHVTVGALRGEVAALHAQKDALLERLLLATERLLAVQASLERRARDNKKKGG